MCSCACTIRNTTSWTWLPCRRNGCPAWVPRRWLCCGNVRRPHFQMSGWLHCGSWKILRFYLGADKVSLSYPDLTNGMFSLLSQREREYWTLFTLSRIRSIQVNWADKLFGLFLELIMQVLNCTISFERVFLFNFEAANKYVCSFLETLTEQNEETIKDQQKCLKRLVWKACLYSYFY